MAVLEDVAVEEKSGMDILQCSYYACIPLAPAKINWALFKENFWK